jgi:O-antigen ligase
MSFKLSKFFIYASVFFVGIVSVSTLFPFIVGKYVWFRSTIGLAVIFFCIGLIQDPQSHYLDRLKKLFKNPIVIAVSVFVAAFILACIFGVNPKMSFWSNFERGEGGLQMLNFYALFLLAGTLFSERKDWDKMFWMMCLVSLLMIGYGVGAHLKTIDAPKVEGEAGGAMYQTFKNFIGPSFNDEGFRFQGSIGNPAYVAVFLIFSIFYALNLLIRKYRDRLLSFQAISLYLMIAVFGTFFILAATRGAFLGLLAGLLVALLYLGLSKKEWRKYALGTIAVIAFSVGLLFAFKNTEAIKNRSFSRLLDISVTTKTFADRATIWKMAFDGFKERPIFGYGPENFIYVFDRHFNPEYYKPGEGFGAWFDRAHSLIFDYLAETGIVGFLSFAAIFITLFFMFFKEILTKRSEKDERHTHLSREPKILQAFLLMVIVAYLVQGLVLFDVSPTYLNVFLVLAFSSYLLTRVDKAENNK